MARSDRAQAVGHDDEPNDATHAEQARRSRWAWITVLGIAAVSGSALVAIPAIAADGPRDTGSRPAARVVVCESGVVDHGDGIRTSSASAEWTAADAPVPDGCTAR